MKNKTEIEWLIQEIKVQKEILMNSKGQSASNEVISLLHMYNSLLNHLDNDEEIKAA